MIAGVFRFVLEDLVVSVYLSDAETNVSRSVAAAVHARGEVEGIKLEYDYLVPMGLAGQGTGLVHLWNPFEVPGFVSIAGRYEIEVAPHHRVLIAARAESKVRLRSERQTAATASEEEHS
ncbi:MAG: hypothetical protein HYT87_11355 [Nitrospirae bacterium]|nr:hypothetical protein [Nitrospirota bacterium]